MSAPTIPRLPRLPARRPDSERPLLARQGHPELTRNPADPRQHIDWPLLVATALVAGIGLVSIYAARYRDLTTRGIDPLSPRHWPWAPSS
jgi:hypothetical protein